jgi:hypothetical protein
MRGTPAASSASAYLLVLDVDLTHALLGLAERWNLRMAGDGFRAGSRGETLAFF